jgi:ribonuclease HII
MGMTKAEREEYLRGKLEEMLAYERELWGQGLDFVGGVDEVGRGPLAGPVCAACVVLPQDFDILGVNDSKKISEKKRGELYFLIVENAVAYGLGLVGCERIDEVNILNATKEAMLAAILSAGRMLEDRRAGLPPQVPLAPETSSMPQEPPIAECAGIQHLLVDALRLPEANIPGTAIVKGDEKSVSIAAASILAKVVRDRIMTEFDSIYPGYGFAKHKGYGTPEHYEGLRAHGITPIHRKTFLRNL